MDYDVADFLEMDADDRIICAVCGKSYILLASHLWQIHAISADDYRKQQGIPGYVGLSAQSMKDKKAVNMRRRMAKDPEWFEQMREKGMTPAVQAKKAASFRERFRDGRFDLDLEPPPEFFDGSGHDALAVLRATDQEWVEATKEKLRGHRGGWVESECQICGDTFGGYKSAERVICYKESCYRERLFLSGQRLHQDWKRKMDTDEEYRAAHNKRLIEQTHTPEAHAKSRATYAANTQRRMEEGPHGEKNYRRGCRCDVCKADHAAVYREYRRTGQFPKSN